MRLALVVISSLLSFSTFGAPKGFIDFGGFTAEEILHYAENCVQTGCCFRIIYSTSGNNSEYSSRIRDNAIASCTQKQLVCTSPNHSELFEIGKVCSGYSTN